MDPGLVVSRSTLVARKKEKFSIHRTLSTWQESAGRWFCAERHLYVSVLNRLWAKLARSKKYRESFAGSVVKRMIPLQIRTIRKQRGWSQARLAREAQLTQGVISRSEDPDYGNLTVNTLVRIAAGFDCAFLGRFVPFSEMGKWYTKLHNEDALRVPSFESDAGFSEHQHNEFSKIPFGFVSSDVTFQVVPRMPVGTEFRSSMGTIGFFTAKPHISAAHTRTNPSSATVAPQDLACEQTYKFLTLPRLIAGGAE